LCCAGLTKYGLHGEKIDGTDSDNDIHSRTLGPTGRAGDPVQIINSGKSLNTELRAPTTVPRPIVIPGATKTSAANHTSSSSTIGEAFMSNETLRKSCVPAHR